MGANACRFSITLTVYWLCVVFHVSWKKACWWRPIKCAILHFLIKYLLLKWRPLFMYAVRKDIDFPRKKNKGTCVNQSFSLTVDGVTQKTYFTISKKNKRRIQCVLSSVFEHIKYAVQTSWAVYARTVQKWKCWKIHFSKLYEFCEERIRIRDSVILMLTCYDSSLWSTY